MPNLDVCYVLANGRNREFMKVFIIVCPRNTGVAKDGNWIGNIKGFLAACRRVNSTQKVLRPSYP